MKRAVQGPMSDSRRLNELFLTLQGRYPFITTIESGLDAAAWERDELIDALQFAVIELELTRQAFELRADKEDYGYRKDRYAQTVSKGWNAVNRSRFALQRHLSEHGPKSSDAMGVSSEEEGEGWITCAVCGTRFRYRDGCPKWKSSSVAVETRNVGEKEEKILGEPGGAA